MEEILAFVWQNLADGVVQRGHAWRTGVLANQGDQGPEARVVVLRHVHSAEATLTFHTDNRSPKFSQLQHNPAVSWVFYDAMQSVQLRVQGTVSPASPDRVQSVWESLPDRSMVSYSTISAPGTPQESGHSGLGPEWADGVAPRASCGSAREWFAVLNVQATALDFLSLRAGGHQRAKFARAPDENWSSTWVTP